MMEQKNYGAVLFDFDYTLGDATESIYGGFAHALTSLGHPVPTVEAVRQTVGLLARDAFTLLSGDASEEGREAFYALFHPKSKQMQAEGHVKLFPGARELLEALRQAGIRTAVVSSKNAETLRVTLDAVGLTPLLDCVVGDGMVSTHKPQPEGALYAMEQLGVSPERVLYCGDTVIDAETAKNAGLDFAAVLNGTTPAEAFAEWPHVLVAMDLPQLHRWLGV